jgi:predicted dehydrogenase
VDVPITTEDQGAVLLRFHNGVTGVLWVTQATAGRKNRLQFEISGAVGAMAWDSEDSNNLWLGHRAKANEVLGKDPSLLSAAAAHHASYPGGHVEGYPDSFKQCFRAFYDSVRGEPGPVAYPSFEDGHREILICEAILSSHRQGRWVDVEET